MLIYELKALIITQGIHIEKMEEVESLVTAGNYKYKNAVCKPVTNGNQVFDIETNEHKIPAEIIIADTVGNRSLVKVRYNPLSQLKLQIVQQQLALYFEGVLLEFQISLVEQNPLLNCRIDENSFLNNYISFVGTDRISILFYDGCYNWIQGKPCKFCDLHPRKSNEKVYIPNLNKLYQYPNADEWWNDSKNNYLKCLGYGLTMVLDESATIQPHKHLFFMAGNLNSSENAWSVIIETIEYLANIIDLSSFEVIINVPPHTNINQLYRLRRFGISSIQYNIEVLDQRLFQKYCPGKISYYNFIAKLEEAVRVFGDGNVRTNIVLGLQNFENCIHECTALAQKGVVVDYSIFQPKRNTALQEHPVPNVSDIIAFSLELADIYRRYNYRPIFCEMSSRSSIMNEIINYREGRLLENV